MRNKVKRTLSFLLTFVMLCSLLPAMALAKEPSERYEKLPDLGFDTLIDDATLEVFTTKDAGTIELTDTNLIENTFPQGSGFRQYKATAKEGWVFDTWAYEQWYEGKDLGNRTDFVVATRYSFSNEGDKLKKWRIPYTEGNDTISVNRLTTNGEVTRNSIDYKIYADFNPTITATAGANGTISDAGNQVEVTYGDDQAFTITANDGYVIETITVDGQEVAEGKNEESYTYTFENVIEPHTIDVTFKVKPEPGKFTVTYEVFGEFPAGYEIPDAVTVNEGDIHTVADVPQNVTTDEGTYTFDGWYNGKDKVGATIAVTSDVTLTGVWTFEGKDDVWNTVYGTIRVYMDEETKADFDALEGNLAKQVRLYSEKYLTDGYRLCGYEPINDFWYTTNSRGVTANDISKIVLAKDKAFEPSSKIEIPIKESGDYTVTVTEGTDKIGWISYSYLRIDITKNEPVEETVQLTYDMNGGTGENVTVKVPKGTVALDDVQNPTHDPVGDRAVVFKGWSTTQTETIYEPDAVTTDLIKTTLENVTEPVTVYAVWAYETAQVPETYPVQVVVYQNGNTETPVVTKTIGSYEKGAPFNVDSLNISDYYNSDYGFETTGWFNDGKWNEYKNGQNPAPLQGEITINGWTNVICMVTDKYPVHVFAVTDGDKANKEEIYSGTALKGTDLIAFLDQNVTVPEKEGYTVDKWYNWDWYGNKYAEDTKVNGWTNAYVTYTSNDTDRTVEVTFTVNSEYGSFTDYGKGPVTFKGLPENSTEQYSVPKVTANAGYKFVGWKGQGTDVIEWGADASTFGVPGLCYFPEGSDVGYASIEAVFEEVPVSGKTVEVTFTVNPEYGSFTEYGKGPVTFKNIDAESTQQFEVPKVTAKKGYKFVGWKGQGADVIEWDANASTFGVPGLCYFAEGSNVGYASIAAVFEKEGGGHTNDYYVTVIVDGKGKVKAENYGTVGSNETEVIIIPDVENSVKFTMEPADGWKVDDVLVDGKSVGDVDSYVLKDDVMLEGPVLKVIFEKKSSGGGGGGSHDKDDDKDKTPAKTPDALNGEDHFDYIVGDADGRVHPERNITRAEVASIFFRLLKDDVRSENLTDQNTFTDVSADAWYNVAVSTMSDMDIVFGRTDYQFDPDAYITRAEFAAIAARFDSGSYSGDDLFTDIEGHWAADQINRAAEKGWITGYPDGTFGPNRYITRAEAVTMINRVLNRMPKDKDALHEDMKVFVDNADINAWYYLAIQEATNSHEYKKDKDGVYETWTDVLPARDWAQYLKLN
ncbi:MAG: S-layer homology domain-containing protein [Anaerotignum sp.]|uniref:S-layer homology domain-containing protein n=1 Tax=Anaerotignum sp. TaxID=2039241 RepID=UPI002E7667AB|nr:S-layer homology domain-containing protein [Anaerotignum sp.]MEE0702823.1 S-layer homology domain-containing protein [Anaerotignum sp.]